MGDAPKAGERVRYVVEWFNGVAWLPVRGHTRYSSRSVAEKWEAAVREKTGDQTRVVRTVVSVAPRALLAAPASGAALPLHHPAPPPASPLFSDPHRPTPEAR